MARRKRKEKLDGFYEELDENRFRPSCSLPFVIITLVIIFLVCLFSLIRLKNKFVSSADFNIPSSSYEIEDYDISDDIRNKFGDKNSGEVFLFDIYEDEMANYLGVDNPNFPLKNATLEIDERGLIVRGKTSEGVLSFSVEVVLVPEINEGKLEFKIKSANAGFVNMPSSLKEALNDYVVSSLNKKINSIDYIEYRSTELFTDYIKITASVREE